MTADNPTPATGESVMDEQDAEKPEGVLFTRARGTNIDELEVARKANLLHLRIEGTVTVDLLLDSADARQLVDEVRDTLDD